MVTDFCPGGELFFHLHNIGRFTEDQARFYFCEIVLALEYLHEQKIIFRDLKPENTLIDLDGHLKLVDFGLAKEDHGSRLHSFCGSHEYLSPEMLKRAGYNRCVDFYSLGSFLYEMLTGLPPFWDKDRSRLYHKILNEELVIPRYLSKNAQLLVGGLLRKDPTLRIGSILGIKEVKNHPWLGDVDWEEIWNKKVTPPFRPNSAKANFETEYLAINIKDSLFYREGRESVEIDEVFGRFQYSTSDKSNNHELMENYDRGDLNDSRSKSFIETVVLTNSLKGYLENTTPRNNGSSPSFSLSPTKYLPKKVGPELLSVRVQPKFNKGSEVSLVTNKNKTKISKKYHNHCNKSMINAKQSLNFTRQSLTQPKLIMD